MTEDRITRFADCSDEELARLLPEEQAAQGEPSRSSLRCAWNSLDAKLAAWGPGARAQVTRRWFVSGVRAVASRGDALLVCSVVADAAEFRVQRDGIATE